MNKKPTIVVVGLLPAQEARVARDCRGVADLKFVPTRKNSAIRPSGDHCVLTKFVDHNHFSKALDQFPRDRVHFSRGGLSALVQTINGIASVAV